MSKLKFFLVFFLVLLGSLQLLSAEDPGSELKPVFSFEEMAPLPVNLHDFALGRGGDSVVLAGGLNDDELPQRSVYLFDQADNQWNKVGDLPEPWTPGAFAPTESGLVLIAGSSSEITGKQRVYRVEIVNESVEIESLPDLPFEIENATAAIGGNSLYLAGSSVSESGTLHPVFLRLPVNSSLSFMQNLLSGIGFSFEKESITWEELDPWPGDVLQYPSLSFSFESLHLFGMDANGHPLGFGYLPAEGWRSLSSPRNWDSSISIVPLGESHIFAFENPESVSTHRILAFHTLTNTWVDAADWPDAETALAGSISLGDDIYIFPKGRVQRVSVLPPTNNYGWVDHAVVVIYLLGMVTMGAWFIRKEKDTKDFFRAGNKVPWWAIGMSLFATGASAISLMTMPGKSYSGNWTFFTLSIYSAMFMPLSLFLLAPLVRKLDISTPNEYLELRFGLTARMMGSIIYMVNQVLGRMAPIIFLPSIAMSAITGIDIWIWILVIGTVTTLYTFMGGLSAVIWTDTIQGLIMVSTVAGCLFLILIRIDMPLDQIWTTLQDNQKLHMFDWGWDVTQPTVVMIVTATIFITLIGIGDQNYVQRVQAAPSLRDAKKAVATQMAVAIPINLILFGLGTALYLYYRSNPVELNPLMKTDGIYPLFAAQHLPVGVSGLVIAALLAASMSTISSAICSVANLGIEDFYRRFKQTEVVEKRALFYARTLSVIIGVLGIVGAIFLSKSNSKSVWDVAIVVTGLITNGIVGFFGLGLLTKKAHELGSLLGLLAGMIVTIYLDAFTPVTFWLYAAIGSAVTFIVGYVLSILIPCKQKPLDGLTVYTLDKPRPRL